MEREIGSRPIRVVARENGRQWLRRWVGKTVVRELDRFYVVRGKLQRVRGHGASVDRLLQKCDGREARNGASMLEQVVDRKRRDVRRNEERLGIRRVYREA